MTDFDWLESIVKARSPGKWLIREDLDYYQGGTYIGVGPEKYAPAGTYNKRVPCDDGKPEYFKTDICRVETDNDLPFIAAMGTLGDRVMAVVMAAEDVNETPSYAHFMALTEALAALQAAKDEL